MFGKKNPEEIPYTHKVYAVRDTKGELYMQPFHRKMAGEAERDFNELVNDDRTIFSKYPEDFDLFELSTFNEKTGLYVPYDTPRHIAKAIAFRKQPAPSASV